MLSRWRLRNRVWGPADKTVVGVVCLALLAGLAYAAFRLLPGDCPDGFHKAGTECVGVTAGASVPADKEVQSLVEAVAEENARVERAWKEPKDGEPAVPYVRIALMMPFTSDANSAMTTDQIRRSLAGALAAQLRANADAAPDYQLLLAHDGKDLDQWDPVVKDLAKMVDDASPLVGVFGMPNSTPQTLDAVEALSEHRIPVVGPTITSADMSADYLFKTSPSNEHFARALERYLDKEPGEGNGFLVWDNRSDDSYSSNLRDVFKDRFGKEYGLRTREASFTGTVGNEAGITRRFSGAVEGICAAEADTVFFAGRDIDLAPLVQRLASHPCDREAPVRILKVGIGMDPLHTTEALERQMRKASITLVDASSVDPAWWQDKSEQPTVLSDFLTDFRALEDRHDLGEKPLDDGYAIMYHDAFQVLSQGFDQAFDDVNESGDKPDESAVIPKKDDVYNTMIGMSVLGTESGADCVNCVVGASGTFGFDDSPDTDKWPVCKPVPVVEFPTPTPDKKDPTPDQKTPTAPYRTHEDIFDGDCP